MASFTITNVIPSFQDAQFKTAYRKAFSDASNIWQQMRVNNEIEPCSGLYDLDCPYLNFEIFKNHMQVSKDCGTGVVKECWNTNGESYYEIFLGGGGLPSKPDGGEVRGFIDSSGRSWIIIRGSWTSGQQLIVDTNGFKQPNKFGKDRFIFFPLNEDDSKGAGIAIKLTPAADRTAIHKDCGYPPCYGTSWLLGK